MTAEEWFRLARTHTLQQLREMVHKEAYDALKALTKKQIEKLPSKLRKVAKEIKR